MGAQYSTFSQLSKLENTNKCKNAVLNYIITKVDMNNKKHVTCTARGCSHCYMLLMNNINDHTIILDDFNCIALTTGIQFELYALTIIKQYVIAKGNIDETIKSIKNMTYHRILTVDRVCDIWEVLCHHYKLKF